MKTSEKRKWQVFGGLVVLLAISLFGNFYSPGQEITPEMNQVQRGQGGSFSSEEVVNVHQLNRKMPPVRRIKRNLFEFEGQNTQEVPPMPNQTLTVLKQEQVPMDEIPSVRYLGMYLEKKEGGLRLAAISNSGRVFVGKVGDVLAGKYRILRIENEYLLLQLTADDRKFRVGLGKNFIRFVD